MFCRRDAIVRALPCLLWTFSNSYITHPEVLRNSCSARKREQHIRFKEGSFQLLVPGIRHAIVLDSEKIRHFLKLRTLYSELTVWLCAQLRHLLHSQSLCQQLTKPQGWREKRQKEADWIFALSARLLTKMENLTCKESVSLQEHF